MPSIRPWFVFEYPCICCLWCCISAPGRYNFQRSRPEYCWHKSVCRFLSASFSSICSSSYPDFVQALWCHDRFSYDLMVVFTDVPSCFLSDALAYFCVLYSLFIFAVSRHFSSFRHQGSCWWWYPGLCVLLTAFGILDALCLIVYVMVSLLVSMSCSSCRVSNRFLNSSCNAIFFYSIRMASTLGGILVINFFRSISTFSLMLLITSLWSLPMLTWLMTVTSWRCLAWFVRM